ncbi:MAG: hypothetical protein IH840_07880 [Candidatus Heimdallarchaeota archaeon]|nr:hypothetical protein [Candidatus Heimdallarchaeota archaeon]
MDQLGQIIMNMSQTGYLGSIHEVKILAYLINSPTTITGKQICKDLNLPDSKVYPALNKLTDLQLITKDETSRPNKYYLNSLQALIEFFENHYHDEFMKKNQLLETIKEEVFELWNPEEDQEPNIAHLIKGNNIRNEILRLMKKAKHKIFLLLAEPMFQYTELIKGLIPNLLDRDVKVDLAFPHNQDFFSNFGSLINSKSPGLRTKVSTRSDNTYIVIDGALMLHITHRGIGDIAILSNDDLLVSYIDSCWVNTECCN